MATPDDLVSKLNARSRDVLRRVVDLYLTTGEPVGSRTLAQALVRDGGLALSPATIRNVMADLQDAGLLYAPHTSAGRLPTESGLRLFIDGLLEVGRLSHDDREAIESRCVAAGRSMEQVMNEASTLLSGLSHSLSLVMAPKSDAPLKHIEFVALSPGRALAVLVSEDGTVENRLLDMPEGTPPSALTEAANYLNARLVGRTLAQTRHEVLRELQEHRTALDEATRRVVEAGVATRAEDGDQGLLIVHGQSTLLEDLHAGEDLERVRRRFRELERREGVLRMIDAANMADGVKIFIGAESEQFDLTGYSFILAPFAKSQEKVIGAIGVIGPTRLNYARIIPMVDYTAKVVGRLLGQG
ncbi:MAG: heat-inducible transcriptional repressor HrcA [Alphaproteobacteria bacterium]